MDFGQFTVWFGRTFINKKKNVAGNCYFWDSCWLFIFLVIYTPVPKIFTSGFAINLPSGYRQDKKF